MRRWIGLWLLFLLAAGTALAQPCIQTNVTALDFDTVRIETWVQRTVLVTNPGSDDIELTISVTGTGFILWSMEHVELPGTDSTAAEILVRFQATVPGDAIGQLHVRTNCPVDTHRVIVLSAVGSTTSGPPLEFDLVSPSDSAYVTGDSLRLSWTVFHEIQPVIYRISLEPPFGPILAYWAGEDTVYTFGMDELEAGSWYTWRVDAIYGFDERSSLSERHFHTPPAGLQFSLISPPDEAELSAAEQTFAWHEVIPGAVGNDYQLWITAADSTGGAFTRTYWTEGDTTHTVSFAEFAPDAEYVWWVIAYTDFDSVVSTEQWRFSLVNTAANEPRALLQPERLAITAIYPNPFNPETRIDLWVPQAGLVRAEVFDLLGRSVAVLLDAPLGEGAHALHWQAPGATGTYLLKISDARGGVAIRKLVVMK